MFFVLSTGRAGSRTAALTFSQSPNCQCLHEPHPQLISESVRYRTGELDHGQVRELLRATRPDPAEEADTGIVHGEAANRLSWIVPVLRDAFPEASFVHLVRDGRDVVSSTVQRGWYGAADARGSQPWQRWRPQADQMGAMPAARWRALDAFARNCWLWAHVNDLIARDLTNAKPGQVHRVRVEQLHEEMPALASSLGLQDTPWVVGRVNRRVREDDPAADDEKRMNRVQQVFSPDDWDTEQRATFDEWCGPLMDELYSGWRSGEEPKSGHPEIGGTPGARVAPDDAADLRQMFEAIRVDVSELKVIRGEMASVLRMHNTAVVDLRRRLDVEQQRVRDSRVAGERLRAQQQARHDGELAELRTLRRELQAAQKELDTVRVQLAQARVQEQALRRSTSYRVGNALVKGVKAPVAASARKDLALQVKNRLKRNEVVRALTGRGPAGGTDGASVTARAGAAIRATTGGGHGPAPGGRQTVLFVLLGRRRDQSDAWVDYIAEQRVLTASFEPVVVTADDDFAVLRRHGIVFEYLPGIEDWTRTSEPGAWLGFVERRLDSLKAQHRPATIVWAQGPPPEHAEGVVPLGALLPSTEPVQGG